jgi:spermidine/putrescine transport system permease protein
MVENRGVFIRFLQPIFVCCAYLFLYLPILVLSIFSFNDSPAPSQWAGFSLRWYKALLNNPDILEAFQVSIIVALSSTVLSVILGTCFVVSSKWWQSDRLFSLLYANLLLPEIILGMGILSIFTFFSIPIGYGSLITGHTILGLGFVVPIIRSRFLELDPILTEASLDLGASYLQTFRRVLLPLLMPSLVASSLLVFTLSLDDFLIAFFCSGPSVQTLSVYVYSMARLGIDPTINAISTGFLVISSIVVFLLCFLKVVDRVVTHE